MKKLTLGCTILLSSLCLWSTLGQAEEVVTQDSGVTTSVTVTTEESDLESVEETENGIQETEVSSEVIIEEVPEKREVVKPKTKALPVAKTTNKPAQGPYIKDGRYVKITSKNYNVWQNFDWKKKGHTSQLKDNLYEARGRYEHQNGQTYFSIYNNKNQWMGYLNAKATRVSNNPQGNYIADGRYVTVSNKFQNFNMYQNFNWKKKTYANRYFMETVVAKGRYEHFNGSTYYSMFDKKGNWLGYVNAKATKTTTKNGLYQADGRYVKVTKKNYEIWQNFNWQKKSNTTNYYGQKLKAKGHYNNYNGSKYFSLFDTKGKWIGYVNANAVTIQDAPYGGKPYMDDDIDYSRINDWYLSTGKNQTGLAFESEKEADNWFRKEGFQAGNLYEDMLFLKDRKKPYTQLIAQGCNHWSVYIDDKPQ